MYSLTEIYYTLVLTVILYMTAWFVLAVMLKRRDVVDSAWGLGFIVVALTAYAMRNTDQVTTHLALALVALWGVRLFISITLRNWGKNEDYRYKQLGELGTAKFWLRTYLSVFLLQGALMIAISTPVIAIMASQNQIDTQMYRLGALVWMFGIAFEAIADVQLRKFLRGGKKGVMNTGLWRYSRHPNYFGEITAWWGAAIVAFSVGQWWGIIGSLIITILLTKVTGVPLLEKRFAKNKEYQAYAKETSILIPLPVKSREKSVKSREK